MIKEGMKYGGHEKNARAYYAESIRDRRTRNHVGSGGAQIYSKK